jgi:hypothetical protein
MDDRKTPQNPLKPLSKTIVGRGTSASSNSRDGKFCTPFRSSSRPKNVYYIM